MRSLVSRMTRCEAPVFASRHSVGSSQASQPRWIETSRLRKVCNTVSQPHLEHDHSVRAEQLDPRVSLECTTCFDNSVGKYRAQQLRNLAPALIGVPSHSIMCKFSQKFHRIIPATPEGSFVAVHIMAKDLELSVPIYSTFSDAMPLNGDKLRSC